MLIILAKLSLQVDLIVLALEGPALHVDVIFALLMTWVLGRRLLLQVLAFGVLDVGSVEILLALSTLCEHSALLRAQLTCDVCNLR